MKNKILAGVVAVVMAVTMLGTVSFAANMGVIAPSREITAQTTKTVLAYAATNLTDAPSEANIIAVVQDTTVPTSIPVVDAKLSDKNYVIILFGGDAAAEDKVVIPLADAALTSLEIASEIVADGVTYTNVAFAEFTYTNNTGATQTITEYGVKFASTADANAELFTETDDVVLENGATLTYGAVLTAIDIDAATGTISATPYVKY